MSFFTVTQGGPDIDDGVYPVTLIAISDPKTVTAQKGPRAGQDIELTDWTFAVDEGDYDGVELTASSTKASGPKSKMYSFLTALLGGKAPPIGASFAKTDLLGRRALATVKRDDSGWPRIENLGAMPAAMLAAGIAKATGVPLAQAPAPAVAPPVAALAAAPLRDQVSVTPGSDPVIPF